MSYLRWSTTIVQYHTPIRIRPLSQSSITIVVTTSTAGSEVSVTGERKFTSILSNGSDEDLSVVSSDTNNTDTRTQSQSEVNCMEPNNQYQISIPTCTI